MSLSYTDFFMWKEWNHYNDIPQDLYSCVYFPGHLVAINKCEPILAMEQQSWHHSQEPVLFQKISPAKR